MRRAGALAGLASPVLAASLLVGPPAQSSTAQTETAERAPTLRVSVVERVAEGGVARALVVLDEPAGHDVTVRVDTRARSAVAPDDYRPVHRRVTVPAGERSVAVAIRAVDDLVDEGPEELDVRLSGASGAEVERATARLTIRDRDPLPRVRVADATFTEPALGHRLGFTRVSLSAPSGRRVVVRISARSGTATAGADFVPLHPTVTFAPGDTSELVSVELLSDDREEPTETMRLAVTDSPRATVSPGGRVTIRDSSAGCCPLSR